jgi:hypothetical protein
MCHDYGSYVETLSGAFVRTRFALLLDFDSGTMLSQSPPDRCKADSLCEKQGSLIFMQTGHMRALGYSRLWIVRQEVERVQIGGDECFVELVLRFRGDFHIEHHGALTLFNPQFLIQGSEYGIVWHIDYAYIILIFWLVVRLEHVVALGENHEKHSRCKLETERKQCNCSNPKF